MKSLFSSGLVMTILIILLALEYCTANCDQGNLGTEAEKDVFPQSDHKSLLGRKMLQGMNGNTLSYIGKSKPAYTDSSPPQQQTLKHSQESISKKKDESSALLEAADEVANLMRKDYRGMARRKPPINNHEPKD